MANSAVKANTARVRRLASATRPSTPDSGVSSRRRRIREPAEWLPLVYEEELAKRVPVEAAAEATWSSVMAAMVPVPASSASRPVASSPARSNSATMIKLASSEEPP